MELSFAEELIKWYQRAHRDLPWRRTSDAYAIWVSEIMLQQTRVAAVLPYYERFLNRFPALEFLAAASDDDLLSCWAGLGYYSRARNMRRAAQSLPAGFPNEREQILALPGIGEYTADAIASIAFGKPHAAVDGNVLRVLSRVLNESGDIGSQSVQKRLRSAANELLDRSRPGTFNQAMMELGATVCLPKTPRCLLCPVADYCQARQAGHQNQLPVKLRKNNIIRETRTVYVIENQSSLLMWQRPHNSDRLAGFWELPEPEHLLRRPSRSRLIGHFKHSITNHEYVFSVYSYRPRKQLYVPCKNVVNCTWIACNQLQKMALSTTARKAIAILHPQG